MLLRDRKEDGEIASKNWKNEAFQCPPRWNEYIPKKNRHSESVLGWQGFEPTEGKFFGVGQREGTGKKEIATTRCSRYPQKKKDEKRTAPSVPKWSPTSVLTGPDQA